MNQGILDLMDLKQKVINEGIKIKKTISFSLSDGIHMYYVFGEPLVNDKGEILGAVTASMDISDLTIDRQPWDGRREATRLLD